MKHFRIGRLTIQPVPLLLTLAIAALGGLVAWLLHLPLPWLMGSLVGIALLAILGLRPLGQPIHMPTPLRQAFVPVIGVAIGGNFTTEILQQLGNWIPSLLALCLYIPLAHFVAYRIYRFGGIDRLTSYYGTIPGGLIESVTMGEEKGADRGMLVLMQFLRLIVTIMAVPLIFALLTGGSVGSGAGVEMVGADHALSLRDIAVLVVAGGGGYWLAHRLRFPAAVMTGPILASAIAHLTGLVEGVPPGWVINMTQVVIGAGLGAGFAGMAGATLRKGAGLATISTGTLLLLAWGFAILLREVIDQPASAIFLAFAPGGITEMSLIALGLQISVIYVAAHHVVRIVLSVSIARAFAGRL
ncbi:MAG: AbrB family transcriptional regulator [Pseudorhodobacter sp.]